MTPTLDSVQTARVRLALQSRYPGLTTLKEQRGQSRCELSVEISRLSADGPDLRPVCRDFVLVSAKPTRLILERSGWPTTSFGLKLLASRRKMALMSVRHSTHSAVASGPSQLTTGVIGEERHQCPGFACHRRDAEQGFRRHLRLAKPGQDQLSHGLDDIFRGRAGNRVMARLGLQADVCIDLQDQKIEVVQQGSPTGAGSLLLAPQADPFPAAS